MLAAQNTQLKWSKYAESKDITCKINIIHNKMKILRVIKF